MAILNRLVGRVFDVVLAPLVWLPPLASLAVLSLVTAIVMLIVFKRTSDQRRLAAVKRSIHAAIFEIRLFNDDLSAIWRAQLELLRHNLTYLRLSLVPMLWLIVPLTLVIAQLQFYYGYDGLAPRQPVLVKLQVRPGTSGVAPEKASLEPVLLSAPSAVEPSESAKAVRLETPTVWLPAAREVVWRLAPELAGEYELRVRLGQETFVKTLRVSDEVARRSPIRLDEGFLNQLLYPSEAPLSSAGPVSAISVAYPEREIVVLGWRLHWMIVYFVLSMVLAFALRKRFKVTI